MSKLITKHGFKRFSKQEMLVFTMLILEYKGEEIGKKINLNEKTVSTYKLRLLKKTGAKTIIGLYLFNQQYGIVDLETCPLNPKNIVKDEVL